MFLCRKKILSDKFSSDLERSCAKLQLALACGEFQDFVIGMPKYGIRTVASDGLVTYSRQDILGAIYAQYRENPGCGIDRMLEEELLKLSEKANALSVYAVLSTLCCHMAAQAQGKAPFVIDCRKIYAVSQEARTQVREYYLTYESDFGGQGIVHYIDAFGRILEETYRL